jgi:CubicO group peptidase (beta-lactamase class C family)
MLFNAHNIVAWHDRTTADHVLQSDRLAALGFRPLSLSIYGSPHDPRHAAVMIKRPGIIAVRSFTGLTQAGYERTLRDMAEQGFGPFIISATGPADAAVFASSFREMAPLPLTHCNLSKEQFIQLNREQHVTGAILVWADVFGSENDPRYAAIWGANPERIAWNVDAVDDGGVHAQQLFDAMGAMGARPLLVAVTPARRIMKVYVDSQIGPWVCRHGMTSEDYQAESDKQASQGLWPVCISAAGEGSAARFAAMFTTHEQHLPRVFRATGSYPVAAIDAAFEKYVKDQNLRGAALAIVAGTRLVYTRGYTFAETAPAYHDIQPSTPFRQASIAMTFCAVAVWKLIEQQQLTLDTPLQSVLALQQPDGAAPRDSRFDRITVRHLLEGTSGIQQSSVWKAVAASAASGGTLPADALDVARWIATLELTGEPGARDNTVYGATDYFLLSLLVARVVDVASFEAALALLVLNPLGQKHTRGSRSLAGVQLGDEARHHLSVHHPEKGWPLMQLATAPSVRTQDRPLVPMHYGAFDFEVLDGCGGLSSSVIDVARLCAMLACRSGNPVLAPVTIDTMLAAAVDATAARMDTRPGSHGFHGFDWASSVDPGRHQVQLGKAGWLPGQSSCCMGITGGLCYVMAQNGNLLPDVTTSWLDAIQRIAEARDWGSVDLFPTFGMASLPAGPVARLNAAFRLTPEQALRQIAQSLSQSLWPRARAGHE